MKEDLIEGSTTLPLSTNEEVILRSCTSKQCCVAISKLIQGKPLAP
jgi:hypothetical protein